MEVLHQWPSVDFVFPNAATRDAMLRTGRFIPENIALIDVDVWGYGGGRKVFVTMPKFKPGTPVDECGRLWVLDSGTVEIFTKDLKMICPPQILVFDLNTDKLIGRYPFPKNVLDKDSLLVTIAVDNRDFRCYNTFAYVADVVAYKLIVLDAGRGRWWRVSSNYFYPYPLAGNFDINNVKFDFMDGVIGLALGPVNGTGDRRLYFHSLASVRESWVSTSVIRNESLFVTGNGAPDAFKVSEYTRPSQSVAEAMTPNGVMFFGLLSNNSIACWNSRLAYRPENIEIVAKDDYTLQFQTGIKIHDGYIWALTSRFQNYIVGQFDYFNINYRILVGSVPLLTYGTSCYKPDDYPTSFNQFYSPFYDALVIKK
ncbi:hypothetical protein AAG570_011776 [Ranatra chinensis]|uniref:Uncharacterized protein n=1 Tax=Ranatra chinensis TaxID=642074 RepID=A0ABD0YGW4_9HEMI